MWISSGDFEKGLKKIANNDSNSITPIANGFLMLPGFIMVGMKFLPNLKVWCKLVFERLCKGLLLLTSYRTNNDYLKDNKKKLAKSFKPKRSYLIRYGAPRRSCRYLHQECTWARDKRDFDNRISEILVKKKNAQATGQWGQCWCWHAWNIFYK